MAQNKQEYATFKELAHILKGSSGNVGAEVLFTVCSQILTHNEAELEFSATELMDKMLDCYPATRASLLHYLNGAHQATL